MNSEINFSAIRFKSNNDFLSLKKAWWIIPASVAILAVSFFIKSFTFGLAIVLSIIVPAFAKQIREGRKMTFSKFAADNNWTFGQLAEQNDLPLGIRFRGHSKKFTDVITGTYKGVPFVFYEYQYTVGAGKNSCTYISTVIKITTTINAPYILLDSRNNRAGAQEVISAAEEIKLEGDFYKHFLMYVEPKNRIDGLSIITPDIMQTVMHANKKYDIELYGNSLFLYTEGDRLNRQYIEDLFKGVDAILAEINHKAKSFKASNDLTLVTDKDMKPINELLLTLSVGNGPAKTIKVSKVAFQVFLILFILVFFSVFMQILIKYSEATNSIKNVNNGTNKPIVLPESRNP